MKHQITSYPKSRCRRLLTLGFLVTAVIPGIAGSGPSGYHVANTFILGGESHWDYITIDSASRRLYIPHGTKVDVIDADRGTAIGEVADTPGVHGVALAPEFRKGFTSNGKADTVTIFDLQTFAHTAEIKTGKKPDAIIYDSGLHRVFVSNGDSDDMTVIDAASGRVAGTIPLGGAPEYAASDNQGTVWVNLEDKDALVTVDGKTLKVEKTTPLPGCKGPSSMAMDRTNRRLFIGCANRTLEVVDPDRGNIIATFPIGEHVDATAFDPENGLVFASTGDGQVTIVREKSPSEYDILDTVQTMRGAKTMVLDPKTKTLYLPTVENVPSSATGPPRASGPGAYRPGRFLVVVVEK